MAKEITIALAGNPNAGKTSLLNALAGLKLHVGNWPGKTVVCKQALLNFSTQTLRIVDLPGTYSLLPFSEEEKIAGDFIIKNNPDVVVQIIDVNLLEKSLFLFFEILALGKKVVLAFNFNKEAEAKGVKTDIKALARTLGVPIVKIEANTGENKDALLKAAVAVSQKNFKAPIYLAKIKNIHGQISHSRAMEFIKKKILPFYINPGHNQKTEKIDYWLLNKFTAFPIFLASMYALFKLTFNISKPIISGINYLFSRLEGLVAAHTAGYLASFLTEGVLNGVGSVLSFVPLIFFLFFLIAILEDTGYLARIVVLLDRLFARFGVSGRFFIPMILGFGCNVPAVLATRTIKDKREKMIAVFTNPFISCSARLAVYVLFTAVFFPQKAILVIMFLYTLGVIMAFGATAILVRLIPDKEKDVLIMELPPYRRPTFKSVFSQAWGQTFLFIKKAGTIIFLAVMAVWFLASLPPGVVYGSTASWLGKIGQIIAPVFQPLGFGSWIFAVALLFGLVAKEAIIGVLGTLIGTSKAGLLSVLPHFISPLGALSFLVFISLYMPCLATISAVRAETNSWRFAGQQIITTIIVAWLSAGVVYWLGKAFGY